MGKKRIVKKGGEGQAAGAASSSARVGKRKLDAGILYVEATYNNTKAALADQRGNIFTGPPSASLGFAGPKRAPRLPPPRWASWWGSAPPAWVLKRCRWWWPELVPGAKARYAPFLPR